MIEVFRPNNLDQGVVKVEVRPQDFSDRMNEMQQLKDKIDHELQAVTGTRFRVELVAPNTIERFTGKAGRVVEHRNLRVTKRERKICLK
ncbi:hypothetical protein P0136_03455 [Lentisphaerota bacterium ZTH]|nr:hypothetical protein P0136_03455 [Lentisphaerota bacterium ZTH]